MLIDLDDRLRLLQEEIRFHAGDLRNRALDVDRAPQDMAEHLAAPAVRAVHRVSMGVIGRSPTRYSELVAGLVEAARGDAGVVLACPGPSVAGVVVDQLGSDEQRSAFATAVASGTTWSCCGITEPTVGSDALSMRAELRPDGAGGYLLSGTKRYVGNASRAAVGVVFARTGPSPLSIRAVLINQPAPGLRTAPLETIGLRGARIGEITMTDLHVPPEALLGQHLPGTRRGIWGAVKAFDIVRVQVAAMALGTAIAVVDYVRERRCPAPGSAGGELDMFDGRIDATRRLLHSAAAELDAGRSRGHLSSLVKLEAVQLAQLATRRLPPLLGHGALLNHPLLEKWRRDSAGFEVMEGTASIQKLNIAEGQLRAFPGGSP